jgi:hypothetical protein
MAKPIHLFRYTEDAHGNEREWTVVCNIYGTEVEVERVESGDEVLDLDKWVARYRPHRSVVDSIEVDALEEFGDRLMCAIEDAAESRREIMRDR